MHELNLLSSTSSAGFILLDIEPSSINRPVSPADLTFSVLGLAQQFADAPISYSVEAAPFWLFGGSDITYEDFSKNDLPENFEQSFTASFAIKKEEEEYTKQYSTHAGIGIKFSFARGEISDYQKNLHNNIDDLLSVINSGFAQDIATAEAADFMLNTLDSLILDENTSSEQLEQLTLMRQIRSEQVHSEVINNYKKSVADSLNKLKELASQIVFKRVGFKLDFAGGFVLDFPTDRIGFSEINRGGLWVTGGYETEKLSILTSARLFFNVDIEDFGCYPNCSSVNNTILDAGLKLTVDEFHCISISGECLGRSYLNNAGIKESVKYDLSIHYQIDPNRVFSVTLGKDFNHPVVQKNNLIVALNILMGLGTERPF